MTTNIFDPARLPTETFLDHIEIHLELASTNDHALELATQTSLPCPALVLAEHQTAGRGRGGHSWQAGPGALTFSLILDRPDGLPRERFGLVSLIAGMAVRAAIATVAPKATVQVKWPNDVYLNGKKAAGILTETASAAPNRLVVGIGINANNSLANAPADIQHRGIALADYLGYAIDSTDLLITLMIELESELSRIATTGTMETGRWRPNCLLEGRQVSIRVGSKIHHGRCLGIDSDGALILARADQTQPHRAGEIISW